MIYLQRLGKIPIIGYQVLVDDIDQSLMGQANVNDTCFHQHISVLPLKTF